MKKEILAMMACGMMMTSAYAQEFKNGDFETGALISMACVIFILPAMFIIFDKLICKTSIDFLGEKAKAKAAARA